MDVPVSDAAERYYGFWSYWLKVLVVLVSLWGVVLEGTLLSIRVAVQPVSPRPPYAAGVSFASAQIRAQDAVPRSLAPAASLTPIRLRPVAARDPRRLSDRNK